MIINRILKGTFEIPEGNNKVLITDPGYEPDVWCRTSANVKPGVYNCFYNKGYKLEPYEVQEIKDIAAQYGYDSAKMLKNERADIKRRCFRIEMTLSGCVPEEDQWEHYDNHIGVDAGLCGFFLKEPSNLSRDMWNKAFVENNNLCSIKKGFGFWSSSGYGDGNYVCDCVRKNNEIVALRISF